MSVTNFKSCPAFNLTLPPAAKKPVRISGPLVSNNMEIGLSGRNLSASRILTTVSPCDLWSPCEKLSRATFIPESMSLQRFSTDQQEGPMVQMILHFLLKESPVLSAMLKSPMFLGKRREHCWHVCLPLLDTKLAS